MSSQSQNQTATTTEPKRRPASRLWWVEGNGEDANWTEVTGLWPTKTGKGLYATMPNPAIPALLTGQPGRFVILPATFADGSPPDDQPQLQLEAAS